MDEGLLKKIVDVLKKDYDDSILFDDGSKKKIDMDSFKEIVSKDGKKDLSFIDGGNLEIIKSPSLVLHFNRIYSCTYRQGKRVNNLLIEFYSMVSAEELEDGNPGYVVECFFTRGKLNMEKKYYFNAFDKLLMSGNKKAEISIIPGIIRRLAELKVILSLPEKELVVIDGNLEISYPYEKAVLEEVGRYNKNIFGFTKTVSLLTKKGDSLPVLLSKAALFGSWSFEVASIENKGVEIVVNIVKLLPQSKHIFRLDCLIQNKDSLMIATSLLKENSKDPVFPGYPYGLIEADRFARVSFKEQESLSLRLKMMMKKDFRLLEPYLSCSDAHSILDHLG